MLVVESLPTFNSPTHAHNEWPQKERTREKIKTKFLQWGLISNLACQEILLTKGTSGNSFLVFDVPNKELDKTHRYTFTESGKEAHSVEWKWASEKIYSDHRGKRKESFAPRIFVLVSSSCK